MFSPQNAIRRTEDNQGVINLTHTAHRADGPSAVSMVINHFRQRVRRRVGMLLALAAVAGLHAQAGIQHIGNVFLLTGTNHAVSVSDTNGSILSVTAGGGVIASGGEAGLWSVAYTNFSSDVAGSLATAGRLDASAFSSSSPTHTFQWSLPAPSNVLFLTYVSTDITVAVTLSNREDGVDISAAVSPSNRTVLGLSLPARLRFDPAEMERFVAPSHTSDSVGWELTRDFFQKQPTNTPASWDQVSVGPSAYNSLYGGGLVFTSYSPAVMLNFTTSGVAWLGAGLSNTYDSTTANVHRPPAAGQADLVLIDTPNGAFLSGSHLGGGAGAGWLMRIGGAIDRSRVNLSRDVVVGAIEHLALTPAAGRTNVALLNMERGPVIGFNWPSSVKADEWLARLTNSSALASAGMRVVQLTKVEAMLDALADTNYLAILNPYGELIPAPLNGGVSLVVSNLGDYVQAGGHWFEVGGHPFYQDLRPVLYYQYNVPYPPVFADFLHLETTNGNASLFGVQPVQTDPSNAWSTNAGALFVPGQLAWGGDANVKGGYFERAFGTHAASNQTWQSPTVRLSLGNDASAALQDYVQANHLTRGLTSKVTSSGLLEDFKQSILIHYVYGNESAIGICTQLTAHLPKLPTPAVLHITQYLYGGFDKQYPDHLPPNAAHWGTAAEFTNFLAQAKARGLLTMPYTNPTFWGEYPRGPYFTANGEDGLQLNLKGEITLEDYFGNSGYTVTPWHPEVQTANTNTVGQFLHAYPVDILFEDQIGARTWIYDMNIASPTPYAYMAGNTARAAEDSTQMPISTENGYDRLANFEAQFCGLAWAIVPTPGAPDWRRFLTDRYLPSTWQVFPVAQHIAHDKLAMNYNDLSASVDRHEIVAWTLGLGYGTTYRLDATELDNVAKRQWLLWVDRLQKSVCARYIGGGVNTFSHRWGSNVLNPAITNGVIPAGSLPAPDHGVIEAGYGDVSVTANLGPQQLVTNDWTLAPYGYAATAPGLVAAHLIPPGGSSAVAHVAETNSHGGLDFWIYSVGNTNVSLVLPPGYNGAATVTLDDTPPAPAQIENNLLTVFLGAAATTNAYLWHGTVTSAGTTPILIDFGRHDGGANGHATVNPDVNGNTWNNLGPTTQVVTNGTRLSNLVNSTNGPTGVGIEMTSGGWNCNGLQNGGLFLPFGPSEALLGEFAIETATEDYFYTSIADSFKLTGLNTGSTYTLSFFGSRSNATERLTGYRVGSTTVTLKVSGPASSASAAGTNRNDHTLAVLASVAPSALGEIAVTMTNITGSFAHLNLMQIQEVAAAPPAASGASTQAVYLVDFGRHDGGVNGEATVSPDVNGNTWNNLGPTTQSVPLGTQVANLVNSTNGASGIDLETVSGGWNCNGLQNGGLFQPFGPTNTLLGELAIETATEDYFFTADSERFRLSGLDPDLRYNLFFFGSRSDAVERVTSYAVGFTTAMLRTSGPLSGASAAGTNRNDHALAGLYSIRPDSLGNMTVVVTKVSGAYAHLNLLKIEEVYLPPSTNSGPGILVSPASLSFITTNGAPNPPAQSFGLTNVGTLALNYSMASNASWLSVSPASGSLAPGAGQPITVAVNAAGFARGLSNAVIMVSDPAATNDPQYVSVSVSIRSTNPVLAIFGSSVAKGWNSSGHVSGVLTNGSWTNGYTYFLTRHLTENGGFYVTNSALPGENTASAVSRFPTAIVPLAPHYVWIAYALGNEGFAGTTDPAASLIVSNFTANLQNLIGQCRANGFYPVLVSVYSRGDYTLDNYAKLKQTHLDINTWNVPSLNVLGTLDDGTGKWIDGYWSDSAHPNDAGYAEFYHSFVPSLFAAIASGRTNRPAFGSATNFARLTHNAGVQSPLTFTPSNTVHSFTSAFRLRTSATGTVAAVRSGATYSTLEVRSGQLFYIDRSGTETVIATNLADGTWHDVALSSRYALSNTTVYVDGALAGSVAEQYVPDQFILGGPAASGRAPTPALIDLQSWCVYRAGWTEDEALAQKNGNLQQSSMEIGAMLDDAAFVNGSAVSNAAQSLSEAVVHTPNLVPWQSEPVETPSLLVFGSSVAKGWNGGGAVTNGSFEFGYAGRLTPVLEETGWSVTNGSVGGNNTASLLARFDTDAVPVDPDVILIGLSLANEGLLSNPDSEAVLESFRSGMTNLIYRSRTNGFYPMVTLAYPNNVYTTNHYAYVKRMNLIMNAWDVPSVNLLGPLDDGSGRWATGYWSDDGHPNTVGHEEMFHAIVPSLFDAIQAGKTNTPQWAGTHGYARLQGAAAQPFIFTPSRTMHGFNAAFRVRSGFTGTVAAVMTSTGAPPVASPATILVDFGRHDGGSNGTATASPDINGNYWNNLSPANPVTNNAVTIGAAITNLITISNLTTAVRLEITSGGWAANGRFNGGLLSPSNSLLGAFAIGTATEDYFFHSTTGTFKLAGLNLSSTYTLRFFGTRQTAETRITTYSVGANSTNLQTSGTNVGIYAANQNDNTIAELAGISPDGNGEISVSVARAATNFAHLGILEIVETPGTLPTAGGTVELRGNALVYVATNGSEIAAPIDADDGSWIEVALSHSYARGLTLLYVDGVLAGTTAEHLVPAQFVLGGPGLLADRPPAPTVLDLQDWCVYRAPWTPDEAMAQHTGALQQASLELCAPLDDASFPEGGSASNRAQSLSQASITATNLSAGPVLLPPGNLQAVSPAYNTVALSWTDHSSAETGFVLERRPAGSGEFWSNRVVVSADTTNCLEYSVPAGTYEYRVSAQEGSLQSDYAGVAVVTVSNPSSSTIVSASGFQFSGGLPAVSFVGSNAVAYALQYTTNLLDASGWQHALIAGVPIAAIGNGMTTNTLSDPNLPDAARAYRLISPP